MVDQVWRLVTNLLSSDAPCFSLCFVPKGLSNENRSYFDNN